LQRIFVSGVLHLEVCRTVRAHGFTKGPLQSNLVASWLVLLEMPWLSCWIRRGKSDLRS
jgi:hypothetical protein